MINNSHEIINTPESKQQMPQCSTPSSSSLIPPPWHYCESYSADEIKMQGMFGRMCLKTSWYEASTYYHLLYEANSHSATSGPANWNNCVNYNIFSRQLFINKNANSDKLCSYTFMGICPIQMYILIQYACQTKLWSTCDCPTINKFCQALFIPPLHRRGYTVLPLSIPRYFSSHFSEQLLMAEIWYLVTSFILWKAFLDPSDSYLLFADLVGFNTHWTYMWGYHKWALAHSSFCLFIFYA
jgi:hypothetical protein